MTNLGIKWLCFCPHRSVIELLLSFESKKLSPPLQSSAARNKRFLFYWGQRRRNTKTMSNLTSSSYYLFFVLCPMLSLFSNSWPFTPLALSSFPLYPHISRSDKREEEWMRERERIRERNESKELYNWRAAKSVLLLRNVGYLYCLAEDRAIG